MKRRTRRYRLKTGCRPNKVDARDWDFDRLGLPAASGSMLLPLSPVQDQGPTSTCVAQAAVGSIHDQLEARPQGWEPFSVLFPYYLDRRKRTRFVRDGGTFIRDHIKAIRQYGLAPESCWEWSTKARIINRQPVWEAYGEAFRTRNKAQFYAIRDSGAARLEAIDAALAAGFPVVFGMKVWRQYTNDAQYIVDIPHNPAYRGGHAQRITGRREGLYRITNSWGERWGHHGHAWFSPDLVASSALWDFTVIDWRR